MFHIEILLRYSSSFDLPFIHLNLNYISLYSITSYIKN